MRKHTLALVLIKSDYSLSEEQAVCRKYLLPCPDSMHKVVWNHFTYQWWEPGRAAADTSGRDWFCGGSQVWSSMAVSTKLQVSACLCTCDQQGQWWPCFLGCILGSFLRAQTSGDAMREEEMMLRASASFLEKILHNSVQMGDFPGGPEAKTPCSQCSGPEFNLWLGN